jgi:hypothetical protein
VTPVRGSPVHFLALEPLRLQRPPVGESTLKRGAGPSRTGPSRRAEDLDEQDPDALARRQDLEDPDQNIFAPKRNSFSQGENLADIGGTVATIHYNTRFSHNTDTVALEPVKDASIKLPNLFAWKPCFLNEKMRCGTIFALHKPPITTLITLNN